MNDTTEEVSDSHGRAASKKGPQPLLRASEVGKSFGGVQALSSVSFSLAKGVALGVVGENGAGKSTLMKILAGIYPGGSFSGSFEIDGEAADFSNVAQAREHGVVLIPQEIHVAPELPIAENMFAGILPSVRGWLDSARLEQQAQKWLHLFDLEVDPAQPASTLSPSEQRLVLIAGALSQQAKVLILDEPTASLSDGEAQRLFRHIARLRDEGIGILFISHRLDDIAEVCDQVMVMRNGTTVAYFPDRDAPRPEIVEAMIGRAVAQAPRPEKCREFGSPRLELEHLTVRDNEDPNRTRVEDVSLSVRSTEIVGLFGLVGAGRTEVLRAVFGEWPVEVDGEIRLDGVPYRPRSPRHAIASGIALLTEDRKATGIFPGHSLRSNLDAASLRKVSRWAFLDTYNDVMRSLGLMAQLDVRAASVDQPIETLSGGNQQKILLGRWLASEPSVLLLDEPTIGVDIGAREEIYGQIEELAEEGCGVLLVSSDLEEVMRLCDRTHVMYKGRITATVDGHPSRSELMTAATGGQ